MAHVQTVTITRKWQQRVLNYSKMSREEGCNFKNSLGSEILVSTKAAEGLDG